MTQELDGLVLDVQHAWEAYQSILHTDVFKIHTSSRRTIGGTRRKNTYNDHPFLNACPTEMDNHADTHCFGCNFRPLSWTGEECSVAPFLAEYTEQEDIPICTGATAYTLLSGEVIILVFGQGLWFGNRMEKSLINPNQCRAFGIPICDDPTDPHRPLGIQAHGNTFIDMDMAGSTCGFITRYPSDHEMETCQHLELSSTEYWDPSKDVFNISSMEAEKSNNIGLTTRIICQMHGHSPSAPPVTHIQDDLAIHEFDRALADVSLGLAQDLMVDRLISNVRVSSTTQGYATFTNDRHHGTKPELLAQKWGIGLERAKSTLKCTTQHSIRSAILPLTRRYRTDLMSQRLRRLTTKWYTDTLFAKEKSLLGNTCAQIYTDGKGFTHVYPMERKSEAGDTLQAVSRDIGIPNTIISDNAPEQIGKHSKFQQLCKRYNIESRSTEPYSPWQNQAEGNIKIVKGKAKRRRIRRRVPKRVWDFGLVWESEIYTRTAGKDGRTALERITGDTPDISEWLDFEFYDQVWYWDNQHDSKEPKIGRWLGVAHRVGSALCYWVLSDKGQIYARTTVQHITQEELQKPEIQQLIRSYQSLLETTIGTDEFVTDMDGWDAFVNDDIPGETDEDLLDYIQQNHGIPEMPEIDDIVNHDDARKQADTYDQFIGAEVCLPNMMDGTNAMARVIKRVKDNDGNAIGTDRDNPLMNTSMYEVEFPDGQTAELQYNIIAENMMSQTDSEGHHYQLLAEISDHHADATAISKKNGFIKGRNGNRHRKMTTRGWKLEVEWKDGSVSWVPLKDLKASNPLELAEYAVANEIDDEPAFHWWVSDILKKRDRLISKVKAKYWRTTHKFGIEVPKTATQALMIDQRTGTTFWTDAIKKEMANVRIAFEKLDGITAQQMRTGKVKPGYKYCGTHMIFDIKMDGKFTRKARLVADGHTTDTPNSLTYSSVVSRESVRLGLLIASLNDLDISACDIGNAYLNADCREKLWTIAGPEFGSDKDSVMVIVRALYGLKSSGAAWRAKLAETLKAMDYLPTEADPDVWMKRAVKPTGEEYYCYMLVYVDDVLHIHHNPQEDMDKLNSIYRLKDGVGSPDRYLGANIDQVQLEDGTITWSMTCVDYLTGAIKNVDDMLKLDGAALKMFGDGKRPFTSSYRPEIDVSPLLGPELLSRYQQLIGTLRWSIELGRIDIMTEISVLSQHLCAPREGHIKAVYQIFRYLQKNMTKNPGRIAFDPFLDHFDERLFEQGAQTKEEWNDFYPDATEALPRHMPEPLGKCVKVRAWVDANHAGNLANRRSHSGMFIYVNNAPIQWFSKRQNTVESSSFGSEFVAMRIVTDMIEALRYKLRCFGIPIDGPAEVFCDNQSVVTNSSVPASALNKRHNAICFHRVREAQAAQIIRIAWIEGNTNIADLLTKTTLASNKKHEFINNVFSNKAAVISREDKG